MANKSYSIFDILGPVMIGPSSSHTAGACRLALNARKIVNFPITEVTFQLHGSFQHTYQGHGSDRALAGGILGYRPDDERLVHALDDAERAGIKLHFEPVDLGNVHPNSIRFRFHRQDAPDFYITGASIGGAAIEITNIDGTTVSFSGDFPTLILKYPDFPGMIYTVSAIINQHNINIATMQVTRESHTATMIIELDEDFNDDMLQSFNKIPGIMFFKAIEGQEALHVSNS